MLVVPVAVVAARVPRPINNSKPRLQLPQTQPDGLPKDISPEDIFHYAYAVFHSPTYRQRYAEFLKIDFPRLPLTSNVALFRALLVGIVIVLLLILSGLTLPQII